MVSLMHCTHYDFLHILRLQLVSINLLYKLFGNIDKILLEYKTVGSYLGHQIHGGLFYLKPL